MNDDEDDVAWYAAIDAMRASSADADQFQLVWEVLSGVFEDLWRFGCLGELFRHDQDAFRRVIEGCPLHQMHFKD